MQLTVQIPDDIAHRLIEAGGDLSRRALEGMALEGMALEGMALEGLALEGMALEGMALEGMALEGMALEGMALEGMALEGMALERMALERMALEDFKTGNLNKPDLRRLLGFGTRWQLDGLLKAHGVFEDYTLDDFERECQALKSLGF